MRTRKRLLRTRVKVHLPITWSSEELSAYSGLSLVARFLDCAGWIGRLRKTLPDGRFGSDFGSHRLALVVMAVLLVGGRRLAHVREVAVDPVIQRFARVDHIPSERTLSRWLKTLTSRHREGLLDLLREVAFETLDRGGMARITLDVDGTVIRACPRAQGAARGFNRHHPKDPSYYPLTAHIAQTGQLFDVVNREGNVNDSVGAAERITFLLDQVRTRLGAVPVEVRLDGAFCQRAVLEALDAAGAHYAMRMPMWEWLGVRDRVSTRKTWRRVSDSIDAFSMRVRIPKWQRTERIVVFRKRISGRPARSFQLDLFQPDDGFYEYSMVTTNKAESESTIWAFMAGRGGHEKTLGELKQSAAFGSVVTDDWDANSAWQILSALTHSLMRDFQVASGLASPRPNTRKRTCRWRFATLTTLRFLVLQVPGRIVRPAGMPELRIAAAPSTRERLEAVQKRLAA